MINWLKFKYLYLLFSIVVISIGIFGLFRWGLKLGVDFKGGTIVEYKFSRSTNQDDLKQAIESKGFEINSIQLTDNNYLMKFPPLESDQKDQLNNALKEFDDKYEELRYETVGPSIGPELIKKTIYAILIAAGGILLWVAYQFKSLKFGISAILAMFHDSFILVSSFSLLGYFFNAEFDFLIVTALLTTLSFSVHDTIVVYDRIRETQKKVGGDLYEISNKAITETMVRSLNNSFTIIFMLVALVLLGGTTVKWFSIALLIGTVFGTYSSPFVAVPLLVIWEDLTSKNKK